MGIILRLWESYRSSSKKVMAKVTGNILQELVNRKEFCIGNY